MSTCHACGKVKYTYREAQLALVEIIIYRNAAIESGSPSRLAKAEKRQERRFYRCRACGKHHLTSERWIPRKLRLKEQP